MLRAVAKHSPELAQAVVDAGALEALVLCLEEFDPSVKESAAWAIGYIASHGAGEEKILLGRNIFSSAHRFGTSRCRRRCCTNVGVVHPGAG